MLGVLNDCLAINYARHKQQCEQEKLFKLFLTSFRKYTKILWCWIDITTSIVLSNACSYVRMILPSLFCLHAHTRTHFHVYTHAMVTNNAVSNSWFDCSCTSKLNCLNYALLLLPLERSFSTKNRQRTLRPLFSSLPIFFLPLVPSLLPSISMLFVVSFFWATS